MGFAGTVCVAFSALLCLTNAALVRICVPEGSMASCEEMREEPSLRSIGIECVSGPDRYGCLEKVMRQQADTTAVSGEDIYLARELYNQDLELVAEMREKTKESIPWRYQGVAVVRRSTITSLQDLRGAKSCHTGYARTAGWNIPFAHLLQKELITMQCDTNATVVEHDVKAAAAFFGDSCVPGKWTPDNETDAVLKRKYSSLCAMCATPEQCSGQDARAGYQGSLSCLIDGNADVAWTKMSAVEEFFQRRSEVQKADYGLLCPNGKVVNTDISSKACRWASRPWNGWLVRSSHPNKEAIESTLTTIVSIASPTLENELRPWGKPVMGVSKPSVLKIHLPPLTPREYLREHKYDTTIDRLGCPEYPVRLCVNSKFSLEKCEALRQVLKSRRVRPPLECVSPIEGNCLDMVGRQDAHITTADGGDIYHAYQEHMLVPVVSERYGLQDSSYFAVAVVKANSGINSLSQLRGKKSCHTGIGKTAGWKIPVVTLVRAGLLDASDCNFAAQMGEFFSSSCVPGAKSPKYDSEGTNPQSLCGLCIGNNVKRHENNVQGRCDRGPIEAYSGYTGAFRCLVEGGGDVAFIKHTTVRDNTNGNNNASWAAHLRAVDFKLLCRNTGVQDVVDYNTCHLARVPAHKVLIDPKLSAVMKEEVRILLLRASEKFPQGQDVFKMFGTFNGRHDLIFKDSATELVNVRMDKFHKSLDDTYYDALTKMDTCKLESTPQHLVEGGSPLASQTNVFAILSAFLAWFFAYKYSCYFT